ncbi:hypothetical protein GJAV_G00209260 [Gymnothorax javanicus]|nr:hypothetical protein GJAV_G00209260 [Gymnothorax javanicus]
MVNTGIWLALAFFSALCTGRSDAWFWNWEDPVTKPPATPSPPPTGESSGAGPTDSGEEPDATIASMGAEIIDVASGIRKVVQTWDQNLDRGAHQTTTAKPTLTTKQPGVISGGAKPAESSGWGPHCLPLDSDLPFCTGAGQENFTVPNFLNQSRADEVRAVLREWAWLLESRCHPSLEWFYCLLLAPRCTAPGSPAPLPPCRSACESLRDSCWDVLRHGRLVAACHSLPDPQHQSSQCQSLPNLDHQASPCLSVSNQKGHSGASLLQLIGDPPPDEITKVYGPDNSPGYVFGPEANTGQLARAHLPNPFFRDFSLLFNLQPTSTKPGVIFSITDSTQQIMYVGVKLSAVSGGRQRVILYYTEPDSQSSYEAASFTVPSLLNTWTRFAISVSDDRVSFYINCDADQQVARFERSPDEMELEAGAGVLWARLEGPTLTSSWASLES